MSFLKKLFGKTDVTVELPPEFLQEDPPDWLVELKGMNLRGSGVLSVRAQIYMAARTGTVDVALLPGAEGGEPRSASGALEKTQIDRLLVILGFSFPADFGNAGGGGTTSVAIHRREPYLVKKGECELGEWLGAKKGGPPLVEVGRVLMEAQGRIWEDEKTG
jgi:hypothetical protein